ncbi:MAG: hypothetical protein ABR968_00020 [Bacteroidales bacterium]|jgi:hypothetical protein
MKKTTLTITSLGLLALLSCWLVFHLSCKKDECSGCYLTNDQLAFLIYTKGQKVIFKNDSTNILDTLYAEGTAWGYSACSDPCNEQSGSAQVNFTFSNLNESQFWINAGQGSSSYPFIQFFGKSDYTFFINPPTQIVTVNGTTYNDVYLAQIDSTNIDSHGEKLKVPWKIYYSKSVGFVRFYMMNGQTISKL